MSRSLLFVAICVLITVHLFVLFAGFVAPYSPFEQFRSEAYLPPTRIHVIDSLGHLHFRPFVIRRSGDANEAVPISFFVKGTEYRILGCIPASIHLFGVKQVGIDQVGVNQVGVNQVGVNQVGVNQVGVDQVGVDQVGVEQVGVEQVGVEQVGVDQVGVEQVGVEQVGVEQVGVEQATHVFVFGTDAYGRDQLSRFLYGGQISVITGLLGTSIALGAGSVTGVLAGFYGGWCDKMIMRASELFLSLPWIYLLLGIRAFLPLSLRPGLVILLLVSVIGFLGWARPARLIRGIVLVSKKLTYVLAAQQFGASDFYIMRRHLLPDALGVILTQGASLLPQYIAAEVTLSFLGLGVSEPLSSWGTMLSSMREITVVASYWWMSLPALALVPVFFCYQLVAQSIHEMTVKKG